MRVAIWANTDRALALEKGNFVLNVTNRRQSLWSLEKGNMLVKKAVQGLLLGNVESSWFLGIDTEAD